MTEDDFESRYCKDSKISREEYRGELVTLECKCNDESCCGWAAVGKSPLSIKTHNAIYNN